MTSKHFWPKNRPNNAYAVWYNAVLTFILKVVMLAFQQDRYKTGGDMAYLSKAKQNWIDAIVANIKSSVDDEYYPLVSLNKMAKSLGIKVFEADLTAISGSLSGFITYDDADKKTNPQIFIEKSMNSERRRFTLAHELGHHFLHEGLKLRLDNFDYSAPEKDALEETEANYFAASLLIPKELLLPKLEQKKPAAELAAYFNVSLSAMKNRIRWIAAN